MSGVDLLRFVSKMVRNGSKNTSILGRDIIKETKNRSRKMLDHIILQTVVDVFMKSRSLPESREDVMDRARSIEQKLKALARGIGFNADIVSADDILKIVTNIDQRWHQMQDHLRTATEDLDLKNSQIKELSVFLGLKTPVNESSVFDDIMVRWTDKLSKFNDLEKALKEKKEESRVAFKALQNIANVIGVVVPEKKDALVASIQGIWTRSQREITDLQQELLQEKEQIKQARQELQNLAKIFGLASYPEDGMNILDAISGKWDESKSLISDLRSSLLIETGKNCQATETLQGLADFMGVETSGFESTIVGGMMNRWTENKREVIDLQRALMEEKEKTKKAQEALQAHLSRPVPVLTSVAIQTEQPQPEGQLQGKSEQPERATLLGKVPLMSGDNICGVTGSPASQISPELPVVTEGSSVEDGNILEDSRVEEVTGSQTSQISQELPVAAVGSPVGDDNILEDSRVDEETHSPAIQISQKLPVAPAGSSVEDVPGVKLRQTGDAKRNRDPLVYRKAKQELQQIKEPFPLSISYRSHSFVSSVSRDLIHPDRCRSLKTFSPGDAIQTPSKSSLLRGVSAITRAVDCLHPSSNTSITVSKMSDLIPWSESRCRIELGSGVMGTVFLYRHAVSKIPVAAKIVEYPGECFQNEVRIHQAISDLPWFPTFYGSFDIAGDQAVLAMEFIGDESEDRSHTLADCADNSMLKTGPDLSRDEWFDVFNDVAQGLKALHSKGFLYNDLKADNVMVVEESGMWRAKIIDLGWASEIATPFVMPVDEEDIEYYQSGRMSCHVAPECVLDAQPFSTSSDVYSLGRLLASVGRAMSYDDVRAYGTQIYLADPDQRPTVQEIIDKLYAMQLVGGEEDDPGSSSC